MILTVEQLEIEGKTQEELDAIRQECEYYDRQIEENLKGLVVPVRAGEFVDIDDWNSEEIQRHLDEIFTPVPAEDIPGELSSGGHSGVSGDSK